MERKLKEILEALLLSASRPISIDDMTKVFEDPKPSKDEIRNALNVLDDHTDRYNLADEDAILMEAICDDYDPTNLSKDTLSCLLDAYKDALADLRCE